MLHAIWTLDKVYRNVPKHIHVFLKQTAEILQHHQQTKPRSHIFVYFHQFYSSISGESGSLRSSDQIATMTRCQWLLKINNSFRHSRIQNSFHTNSWYHSKVIQNLDHHLQQHDWWQVFKQTNFWSPVQRTSVRPSTSFSTDTNSPIFCCKPIRIPIRYRYT